MKNLCSLFILLGFALVLMQCKDEDPSCVCIEIFLPVCGDDGQQYDNDCFAQCAKVSYTPGFCPEERDGLILDFGDPASGGCGWVVQFMINDSLNNFYPDTIPPALQVDQNEVRVNYRHTLRAASCGFQEIFQDIEVSEMVAR